jgi:hypothetical protein
MNFYLDKPPFSYEMDACVELALDKWLYDNRFAKLLITIDFNNIHLSIFLWNKIFKLTSDQIDWYPVNNWIPVDDKNIDSMILKSYTDFFQDVYSESLFVISKNMIKVHKNYSKDWNDFLKIYRKGIYGTLTISNRNYLNRVMILNYLSISYPDIKTKTIINSADLDFIKLSLK